MPDLAASPPLILLVDDNQDDVILVKRAFARAGIKHPIIALGSGVEAIAYLSGDAPYRDRAENPLPAMVMLDIKMPATDGFAVLQWIRLQPQFGRLCVVMLTSSDQIRDVNRAYELGANSFLVKPLDFWNAAELSRSVEKLLSRR